MATGVGRSKIPLVAFISRPQNPYLALGSRRYFLYNLSYSQFCHRRKDLGDILHTRRVSLFCLKFCCYGNWGSVWL